MLEESGVAVGGEAGEDLDAACAGMGSQRAHDVAVGGFEPVAERRDRPLPVSGQLSNLRIALVGLCPAETLSKVGESGFLAGFMEASAYGTPEQIIAQFATRRELIGDFELGTCFRFGGLPHDQAEESMRLFAAEVLPELHSW